MNWNSSNHPISDLRDWNNEKKLEIRPDFQRREVWSKVAKIMLIDTIIKNIPMPKLYLETRIKNVTYRIVIDGQQRITAILEYINGVFVMPEKYEKEWAGKKFAELTSDQQNLILNYELNINNLVNPTEAEVRDLYSRVNKYTVQLNKQELRKCDYPGDFIKLAEEMVENEFFDNARVFSAAMTRRMNDVEYVEELLIVLLEGIQDKKKTIDFFCEQYEKISSYEEVSENFKEIILDIETIFTKDEDFFISKTRFKQRTDLYSVFSVICSLKKQKKELKIDGIEELQKDLLLLDKEIKPLAEDSEYSTYAIKCTSDANSYNSRSWRHDFLYKYFEKVYR